ncbi:MAG: ferrous iron transporter B [Armatimonadetes bacterium]|nr:ferrous iron transporter B [Armatimonadota bacterium]
MQPSMTPMPIRYDAKLEDAINLIVGFLNDDYGLSKRAIALLLLQGDREIWALVEEREGQEAASAIRQILREIQSGGERNPLYRIAMRRQMLSEYIAERVIERVADKPATFSQKLGDLLIHPIWGTLFLLALLYFGFYQFVGVFAAGTLVELLEDKIFGNYILPPIERFFNWLIPWALLRDLFVGEYGIFTLGIRYAIALLLPIVTAFFLVFSLVEDSGYFPRLALLVDRLFKKIGLSGRAVIPMVLGFGCDTMATLVTRILETRRERIIATLLLALAIPCSAQLGVMMATVSKVKGGILLWTLFVFSVFLLIGYLTSRLLPGEKPRFFIEVVPLRVPKLDNVLVKTWTRLQWYLLEVTPLFILASVLIWLGQVTQVFDLIIAALSYPVQWVGLPKEVATVILFGFFRRDYGAAGLLDMVEKGAIGGIDLVTTAIILTLFVPCIAQFLMMVREHGWLIAAKIAGFIFPFAFLCGFIAKHLLTLLGHFGLVG